MLDDKGAHSLAGAVHDAVTRIRAESRGIPLADLVGLSEAVASRATLTMRATAEPSGETLVVVVVEPCAEPRLELDGLTARQAEVANLIVRGCSNRQIAERLGISPATVKDHVHAVLRRTGSARRAALAGRQWRTDANPEE